MILEVTSEIKLQTIQLSDAQVIFNTINEQRLYLGRWLPFVEATKKVEDTLEFIKLVVNQPKENMDFAFTIRKNGTFVGLIHIKSSDIPNKRADVGYWLSKQYQGQGIVTKSLDRLCTFAFDDIESVFTKNFLEKDQNTNKWKETKTLPILNGVSMILE